MGRSDDKQEDEDLFVTINVMKKGTLPTTWDIASVYASVDEWQADYDTVMGKEAREKYAGRFSSHD